MDIILNPTNKCNFACQFCAASELEDNTMDSKVAIEIIKPYANKLGQIIINGGDPLCMNPKFYWDLLKYINTLDHYVTISLTTNLWDFYKQPYKWKELFKEKQIGVITSFQYGTKRRLKDGRIFSEQMFRDCINMFEYVIEDYKPNFISVIDKTNQHLCKQTLLLARDLGIKCKMNKVVVSGRQKEYYPRYEMFKEYINLYKQGLGQYEMNYDLLKRHFMKQPTFCPIDRNCYNKLRCVNANGLTTTCSYVSESLGEDYKLSRNPINKFAKKYATIRGKCYSCENFALCNSCRVYIKEVKDNKDETNYCANMKKIIPELREVILNDNTSTGVI